MKDQYPSKLKILKVIFLTPKYGVPQGSPLSPIYQSKPLSPIVYVNNISQPENVQPTTLLQFADDTVLWAYGRNTILSQYKMQKHLDKIIKWCNIWIIKLNPLKTKVLHVSKRKHPSLDCSIKMDNVKLKAEKSVKFLGIIFDHKLVFEEHIKDKINNTRHITSIILLKVKNIENSRKNHDKLI